MSEEERRVRARRRREVLDEIERVRRLRTAAVRYRLERRRVLQRVTRLLV